jgi:hypothetical protein
VGLGVNKGGDDIHPFFIYPMTVSINDGQPGPAQFHSGNGFGKLGLPLTYPIRIGRGRVPPSFDRWPFLPSPIRPLNYDDREDCDFRRGMIQGDLEIKGVKVAELVGRHQSSRVEI